MNEEEEEDDSNLNMFCFLLRNKNNYADRILNVPSDNVLQSCGAQEILLFQSQFFATKIVIIRVQNPGNVLRNIPVNDCVQVVTVIEKL